MTDTSPAPLRWLTCDACQQPFHTDWPEANALAEFHATFPAASDADRAVVCPDCYQIVLRTIGIRPQH